MTAGDPETEAPATYFQTAIAFRAWLEANHDSERELWVGYYKKGSGGRSITYAEAVEQALCFGWIDGKVQTIDGERYRQRFTPRKPTSNWSNVNIARMEMLLARGLVHPAGLRAYAARSPERSCVYSFEQDDDHLAPEYEERLRANTPAWEFLQAQPPSYRKVAIYYVMSEKREDTRERRLAALIDASARAERLPQFISPPRRDTGHTR